MRASFGFVLGLPFLVSCSTPDSTPSSTDALTDSTKLSLTFDGDAKKVHAKFVGTLDAATTLYVRVRHEKPGPVVPVDCDAVQPDATPIRADTATPVAGGVEFVGPEVDTRFIESAYLPREGADDENPVDLSIVESEGPISKIEACLIDANQHVVASASENLMSAWDKFSTPPADGTLTANDLRILAGVQLVTGSATLVRGAEQYAKACQADLGELPMFANGQSFDCISNPAMHVVPITVSDPNAPDSVKITLDETTTNWPLTAEQNAATKKCDRPAWLGYDSGSQCAPFTRIGQFVNSQQTRFVVVCRRYKVRALSDPHFDDINMIGHNPTNGKTCFFNSQLGGQVDGTKVPSPDGTGTASSNSLTVPASSFWMAVGDVSRVQCAQCHDSDPWMHSPWVDQVRAGGRYVVPRIKDDPAYGKNTKYSIGSAASLRWQQPKVLADAGSCGDCHRIGNAATSYRWAPRSVGDPSDATWKDTWLSDAYKTFQKLHWMPTTPPASEAEWNASEDKDAVAKILNCGRSPSACTWVDTPK